MAGNAEERIKELFQKKIVHVLMQLVMLTGPGLETAPLLFPQQRILDAIWQTTGQTDPAKAQDALRKKVQSLLLSGPLHLWWSSF